MYVFGYGSIIWNPGFEFQTSELAEIKNYKRSFSMWSIHHRGTVKRPGLVLALEKCNGHSCQGAVSYTHLRAHEPGRNGLFRRVV